MRCCGPKEEKTGPKPLSDRRCTDILILILFALFWGGLVAIFTVVWSTGDTMSLFYDADYLGNRCGVGALKNRTKAYYPRMADDLLEQRAYLQAGAVWNIQLYTLWCAASPLLLPGTAAQAAQPRPHRALTAPSPHPHRTLTAPSPRAQRGGVPTGVQHRESHHHPRLRLPQRERGDHCARRADETLTLALRLNLRLSLSLSLSLQPQPAPKPTPTQ